MHIRLTVLILVALALLQACRNPASQSVPEASTPAIPMVLGAAGNGQPPNPVYICDGITGACNVLGTASNPLVTTGGGTGTTTIACDAGNCQVAVVGIVPVTFDAGNAATAIVGIVPVSFDGGSAYTGADLVPGDLSSSISATTQATSSALVKAQAGTFILANACNEGTVLAWLQFYNAQALDAGGLDAAATAPKILPLRLAAGACGSLREPNAGFTNGIVWYSSLSQGLVNNPGGSAPMAVDVTYR